MWRACQIQYVLVYELYSIVFRIVSAIIENYPHSQTNRIEVFTACVL